MASVSIVVTGRVQGVGFRAYAFRVASSLGVRGEAWNRRDGGVELIAQHDDEAALAALAERLKEGPGWVEDVRVEPLAHARDYGGFDIGPTR